MFSFLLKDLCSWESVVRYLMKGWLFSSFPPLPKQKFKLKTRGKKTQENDMISINKCSSFSSPVNVTFGYETEFCKITFLKIFLQLSVFFITIDTDERLKNHISLSPTPFLPHISNRRTSWVIAITGALHGPFSSPVAHISRDGALFWEQAFTPLPWMLTAQEWPGLGRNCYCAPLGSPSDGGISAWIIYYWAS